MGTYVVGDVQGCFTTLQRLLERVRFDPAEDRLWIAGDLVNRGPDSLATLRWARSMGERLVSVLGNHDFHLIGRALGLRRPRKRDTLDEVLAAGDRDELIEWLVRRPLLHREEDRVLVHAGIPPGLPMKEIESLASEAQELLGSPKRRELLSTLYKGNVLPPSNPKLRGVERLRCLVESLTRIRTVKPNGEMCLDFSGPPSEAPEGCRPWFELVSPRERSMVVFGHWSTLGLYVSERFVGLDTGCVWGGPMTAIRLEDRRVFQEPSEMS